MLQQAIDARWVHNRRIINPSEDLYNFLDRGLDYNKSVTVLMINRAKMHRRYTRDIRIRDASDFARIAGMIMISVQCMQWERLKVANELGRIHQIGNYRYCYLYPSEITANECRKHIKYVEELYI